MVFYVSVLNNDLQKMVKNCQWDEGCESSCEGSTDFCATHNRMRRKMEKDSLVAEQKRKAILSRPKVARKPPKKVSDKRAEENVILAKLVKQFLHGRWCAKHGRNCIPTTVHHAKGRIGYADDWARENEVPLLLDVRFFVALCFDAHRYAEENPEKAKEEGLSFDRLTI